MPRGCWFATHPTTGCCSPTGRNRTTPSSDQRTHRRTNMLEHFFSPMSDWGPLILRVALGILFPFHGWMKLNPKGPMKGPAGFACFLKQLGVPLPVFFAWMVALLETGGAVRLILGLGTRILAHACAVDMLVAIQMVNRLVQKAAFPVQE